MHRNFCGGKIGEEDVLSVFGLVSAEQLHGLVEALFAGETKLAIEKLVDDICREFDAIDCGMIEFCGGKICAIAGTPATMENGALVVEALPIDARMT